MDDRNLLFQNAFTKTKVPKPTPGINELYKIVKVNQNKFNEKNYKDYLSWGNGSSDLDSQNIKKTRSLYKEKVTLVPIDSRYRNQDIYPDPNHFVISLRKKFQNIKSLELVASIFPNTDDSIIGSGARTNNTMYWQNQSDLQEFFISGTAFLVSTGIYSITITNYKTFSSKIEAYISSVSHPLVNGLRMLYTQSDISTPNSVVFYFYTTDYNVSSISMNINLPPNVYSCSITQGNYNIQTIIPELQTQMSSVLRSDNATFHYFYIVSNQDTDLISFESLLTTELNLNPINTVFSNYVVTVSAPTVPAVSNSVFRVIGATTTGGISSTLLNDEFSVTPVVGGFEYTVITKATTTGSGGGNAVIVGQPDSFKFLFSSLDRNNQEVYNNNIQQPLGFAPEESGFFLNPNNSTPLSTVSFQITDIIPGTSTTIQVSTTIQGILKLCKNTVINSITNNIITTNTPHNLTTETQVQVYCINSILLSGQHVDIYELYTVLPLSTVTLKILNLSPPLSIISLGNNSVVKYGDRIRLQGVSLNSVYRNYLANQFFIESFPTANSFTINYNTTGFTFVIENSISNSSGISLSNPNPYVTTSLLKVNHPGHGFNEIVQSDSIVTRTLFTTALPVSGFPSHFYIYLFQTEYSDHSYMQLRVIITGALPSNMVVGNYIQVYLESDPSSPNVLKGYYIIKIIAVNFSAGTYSADFIFYNPGYTFPDSTAGQLSDSPPLIISGTNNVLNSLDNTYNLYASSDPHTFGIFSSNITTAEFIPNATGYVNTKRNDIRLFRVYSNIGASTVADVPLDAINGYNRDIRLLDSDNYYISIDNFFFFGPSVSFGGNNVMVSSDLHGFSQKRSNTKDWNVSTPVYRKISLEGENYVFLSIPHPKMDSVVINPSTDVADIFAQILLSESPGNIIFNSFVTVPYLFDPYLSTMDFFEIKILYTDGNLYDFKDTDFSITLKITEVVLKLESEEEKEEIDAKNNADKFN